MNEEYIEVLRRRLEELMDEIEVNREKVQDLLGVIKTQEEHAEYIIKLLEAEGVSLSDDEIDGTLSMSVSDMAYEVLSNLKNNDPLHYRELAELIMAEGKYIPGQDPAANLISHLSRDERFTRTGRGMYGLSEWGLIPAPTSSKRKGKKRR